MSDVDEMVVWLRSTLDDVERVAKAAAKDGAATWLHEERGGLSAIVRDGNGDVVVYDEGSPTDNQAAHIALHDPAAVLRRVEADRRILDLHERDYTGYAREPGGCGVCLKWEYYTGAEMESWPCPTVRVLASGWSHMPGYRPEWAP